MRCAASLQDVFFISYFLWFILGQQWKVRDAMNSSENTGVSYVTNNCFSNHYNETRWMFRVTNQTSAENPKYPKTGGARLMTQYREALKSSSALLQRIIGLPVGHRCGGGGSLSEHREQMCHPPDYISFSEVQSFTQKEKLVIDFYLYNNCTIQIDHCQVSYNIYRFL